jgi:hypothetical protein
MRFAGEAIVRVRNMDQPQRTVELARMGALAARLGNKEGGQEIVKEAAEAASKWEVTDRNRWDISYIAQAVATCDVPLARVLLEKFPESERGRFAADMAGSLDDIEQAEQLLKDHDQGSDIWYSNRARIKVACRIAAKQPAEAVKIVEKVASRGYGHDDDDKAQAFGWMAMSIAPSDPKLACSLVDRSLALYLTPNESGLNNYGGRPAQAAVVAVIAQKIGYPDMESVIYRVLATRATTKGSENRGESPARILESNTMQAMFLAMVDADTAEQVLRAIEPQSASVGSGSSGIGHGEWLKAWALVNPPHAVELAEKEWADAKTPEAKQRAESDLMEIVDLWLSPSGDRMKQLSRRFGGDVYFPTESEDN